MTIAELFLSCANGAAELIDQPAVADAWDAPSVLEGYAVAGLAGHLARAVLVVERYLDAPTGDAGSDGPETPSLDAAGYFAAVLGDHDPVDSELHRSVRERGQDTAAAGPAELAASVHAAAERLAPRLDPDTLDRPLAVLSGVTLPLGEYLRTRLVELVVHCDDLAVSIGTDPDLDEAASLEVVRVLAELAALRGGALEAVRALARRERHPDALRAL